MSVPTVYASAFSSCADSAARIVVNTDAAEVMAEARLDGNLLRRHCGFAPVGAIWNVKRNFRRNQVVSDSKVDAR